MKTWTVTQVYTGYRDFQNIKAKSREKAMEIAEEMLANEDIDNDLFDSHWFAEEDEEE